MAEAKNSSIIVVQGKGMLALPAGLLGFSALIEPDAYDPKKPKWKINTHYTPPALDMLRETLQTKVIDMLLPEMEKLSAEAKMKAKPAQSAEEWLEDQLKEVTKEGARITLPFVKFQGDALRRGNSKRGEADLVPNPIRCWPQHGNTLLDIKKLRLGMGSTIVPIVYGNLFRSKAGKDCPQISLKLVGFRVIQLVQFGGGGAAPEETDDSAIREALGSNVDAEDLSMYAAGGDDAPEVPQGGDAGGDVAESPEDKARAMFG